MEDMHTAQSLFPHLPERLAGLEEKAEQQLTVLRQKRDTVSQKVKEKLDDVRQLYHCQQGATFGYG
jgi:hypothetical protein